MRREYGGKYAQEAAREVGGVVLGLQYGAAGFFRRVKKKRGRRVAVRKNHAGYGVGKKFIQRTVGIFPFKHLYVRNFTASEKLYPFVRKNIEVTGERQPRTVYVRIRYDPRKPLASGNATQVELIVFLQVKVNQVQNRKLSLFHNLLLYHKNKILYRDAATMTPPTMAAPTCTLQKFVLLLHRGNNMKNKHQLTVAAFGIVALIIMLGACAGQAPGPLSTFADFRGKTWYLRAVKTAAGEVPVMRTAQHNPETYTLVFGNDERLSGMGFPNRYMAPFTMGRDNALTIGVVATTMMMGFLPAPGLDEHEYFAHLAAVNSWSLIDGRLLLHADGAELLFTE
jgi:heat shock protein HslJ